MPVTRATKKFVWTYHAKDKMREYRLSEQRVRRVIHSPSRIEEGIAPNTLALMQGVPSPKHPYEIWVMLEESKSERKVISVWRYPGKTKLGESIPAEILRELRMLI